MISRFQNALLLGLTLDAFVVLWWVASGQLHPCLP